MEDDEMKRAQGGTHRRLGEGRQLCSSDFRSQWQMQAGGYKMLRKHKTLQQKPGMGHNSEKGTKDHKQGVGRTQR